ncbi:MAG: hypothetical protein JXA10_09020 [Anaerolineae bacterium]|nr:hypothetical protein [Anaerolineae bacterium]
MIKEQLIQARDLIQQKRYDEARAILHTVEHPTAQQWIAKLNRIAPPGESEIGETRPSQDTRQIKALMLEARDLIMQKNYDAAHNILEQINHPTAREWLGKLTMLITAHTAPPEVSTGQLSSRHMPAPAPTAVDSHAPVDPAEHDAILRQAQEALLKDQYEQARTLLAPLKTPEAAFWLEKTGMTRFRTYENIWLDMFRYELPPTAKANPDSWACRTCGRKANQALSCPKRDQNPCPIKISTRSIEEPRRLALLLQALYLDQHEAIETIIIHIETTQLAHWRTELKWQLENMNQVDVRRAAIEDAIPLLDRHIRTRLEESKEAVKTRTESKPVAIIQPPAQPTQPAQYTAVQAKPSSQPAPALTLGSVTRQRDTQQQVPPQAVYITQKPDKPILKQIVNTLIRFFINQ